MTPKQVRKYVKSDRRAEWEKILKREATDSVRRAGSALERVQRMHAPTDFLHCDKLHPQFSEVNLFDLSYFLFFNEVATVLELTLALSEHPTYEKMAIFKSLRKMFLKLVKSLVN